MIPQLLFFIFVASTSAFAQSGKDSSQTNLLALSQGISSPHFTTGTILSNGFTKDNPVGASYLNGFRSSFQVDGGRGTGFGADLGLGDSQYGMSVGYRQPSACENCNGFARGQLSANWGGFGLGLGATQDVFTVGTLLGMNSSHRLGFVAEFDQNTEILDRVSFGAGYAYINQRFTASVDGSYTEIGSVQTAMISPAVAMRIRMVSVSLTYDTYLKDDGETFNDQGWFGIGYMHSNKCHVALYGDFVNQWNLSGSYFF